MASRINSILVFLLLLFLPTQLGKHFFMDFSFINGVRIDYLAPTFYLVDILALLLIAFNWKVIWRKIVKLLNCYIATSLNCLIGLLLLVGINVIGAKEPMMGLYVVGRLVEMYALFVVFSGRSRNEFGMTKGSFGMTVLVPLFIGSVVELFLSLSQLITQHSLQGIFYFLGERAFSVSTPGIATISMFGNQVLRAYGTFSHPNSMGGFYLLLYVFVLFTPRFFSLDFARDQNDKEVGSRNKFGMTTLLRFGILVISSCLILISFSKVAIVCFVLVNAYSSLKELKLDCRFCKFARVFILGVVSLIFLSGQSDILSWDKRVLLIKQSFELIAQHPLFGVGLGNSLYYQSGLLSKLPYSFIQPVHNIFLLFVTEVGIVITGAIVYRMWRSRNKFGMTSMRIVLLVIVITGFFDHYWLTLIQNQILIGVILGMCMRYPETSSG